MSSSFIIKKRELTRTENGQKILFGMKPDASVQNIQQIKQFFKNRIFKNAEIADAKPGLYTWILKNDRSFYASKTFSKQELGTLHINLKMLTNSGNESNSGIYAAGELEVVDEGEGEGVPTILFNLLSGTFMIPKFKKLSNSQKISLRNKIVDDVQTLLMDYGVPSTFLESSNSEEERIGGKKLIESANIRTSPKKLAILNQYFQRISGGVGSGGAKTRKRRIVKGKTLKRK
jgi:hypothetical protein